MPIAEPEGVDIFFGALAQFLDNALGLNQAIKHASSALSLYRVRQKLRKTGFSGFYLLIYKNRFAEPQKPVETASVLFYIVRQESKKHIFARAKIKFCMCGPENILKLKKLDFCQNFEIVGPFAEPEGAKIKG